MALKEGEVYKCPDPNCGCEITVTKGAGLAGAIYHHAAAAVKRGLRSKSWLGRVDSNHHSGLQRPESCH